MSQLESRMDYRSTRACTWLTLLGTTSLTVPADLSFRSTPHHSFQRLGPGFILNGSCSCVLLYRHLCSSFSFPLRC